jgi:hypothetical protein
MGCQQQTFLSCENIKIFLDIYFLGCYEHSKSTLKKKKKNRDINSLNYENPISDKVVGN